MPIVSKTTMIVLEIEEPMIENVELTLKILKQFADEQEYPTRLTVESLYQQFPDEDQGEIDYSVICAIRTGLLDGNVSFTRNLSGPQIYRFGRLTGLSPQGGIRPGSRKALRGRNGKDQTSRGASHNKRITPSCNSSGS